MKKKLENNIVNILKICWRIGLRQGTRKKIEDMTRTTDNFVTRNNFIGKIDID